jgi:hypothetical protein
MSTAKVAMTDFLPTNFSVRKLETGVLVWRVEGTDMKLDNGCVKLALRYPSVRTRDNALVARLEIAYIKGETANGGKTFVCQQFDVSKAGRGANWINVKANSTAVNVITGAARLNPIEQQIAETWAENNLEEDKKTTASLRIVPAGSGAAFEFTTRINFHPMNEGQLAKMPVGIDKFVFVGPWSLIDSDSQAVGNWGTESITVNVDTVEDLDLALFNEVPAEVVGF